MSKCPRQPLQRPWYNTVLHLIALSIHLSNDVALPNTTTSPSSLSVGCEGRSVPTWKIRANGRERASRSVVKDANLFAGPRHTCRHAYVSWCSDQKEMIDHRNLPCDNVTYSRHDGSSMCKCSRGVLGQLNESIPQLNVVESQGLDDQEFSPRPMIGRWPACTACHRLVVLSPMARPSCSEPGLGPYHVSPCRSS
jgi:hypothetical protein